MRTLTYSRNVFVPVTDLCRNRCGYCGLRRDPEKARIIPRSEAQDLLVRAAKAGCSEALFSMGESPWEVPGYDRVLGKAGVGKDLVSYLIELCEKALDLGLLPHTNVGILFKEHLEALAPLNASMGLMLETTARVRAHEGSPGKSPEKRLEFISMAGRHKIPFTSGMLVGIGESREDRIDSLRALARIHESYGHIQEIIVQPFDPKPGTEMALSLGPSTGVMMDTVSLAREILPESVSVQIPPNLVEVGPMIEAGASDIGGLSPITPDWINPDHPWPDLGGLVEVEGVRLRERLPIYPRYVLEGWYSERIEKVVRSLAGPDGYRAV